MTEPWRLRFWSVFSGQALSLIGSGLTQFVLLWWITDTTGRVEDLALAGLAALLPQALLGPIGGAIADRYDRRLIMILSDLVSALCMAVLIALFLSERVELWHVYVMMAIRSAMQAFQAPAAGASTAMLVPASFLTRAAGLNQTLQGIMTIAAAPLGALALAFLPIGWALAIDVVTAVLGILPLLIFRIPQIRTTEATSMMTDLRIGVQIVWQNPGLWRLYALMALVVMCVMPSFSLVPLLVKVHFGGGVNEVALMEGLAGAGMIAGGALAALIAPQRKIGWVLSGLAASCFLLALVGAVPGSAFWPAVAFWTLSGAAYTLGAAPMTALIQTIVPNEVQGRVLSLLTTVSALAAPLGLAAAAPLGEMIGIRWLFVVMGLGSGIVMLAGFFSRPLRRIEEPDQ